MFKKLLVYGFIFKVVLQCFVTFLQDFVNLKGEVFFPNLTFEMEKVRDEIVSQECVRHPAY